jgi:hypothetical protein
MRTTDPRLENFRQAYLQMAREAKYRPQAPSDGFGNIQLTLAEVQDPQRLQAEAAAYAVRFLAEEDDDRFWIGCSDFRTAKAFIWAIESARLLASGDGGNAAAIKLLHMAAREVARVEKDRSKKP